MTEQLVPLKTIPQKYKLNIISIINPVLGFVVSNWQLFLFLGLIAVCYIEYRLIGEYRAEVAADKTSIASLETSLKQSNQAIADQNKAIQDAQAKAAAYQKQLDDLNATLTKQTADQQKLIALLKQKPAGTTDADAIKFINDYLGTLQWSK